MNPTSLLFLLALSFWACEIGPSQGFAVVVFPCAKKTSSSSSSPSPLAMGLFDSLFASSKNNDRKTAPKRPHRVYQGMSKTEEAVRKKNTYQGPKITVRDDEDGAMWIEESSNNSNKKKKWGR